MTMPATSKISHELSWLHVLSQCTAWRQPVYQHCSMMNIVSGRLLDFDKNGDDNCEAKLEGGAHSPLCIRHFLPTAVANR